MSKKNIIRIVAILILAIGATGLFIAKIITPEEAKAEVAQKPGYSTITSVAGCTFMVNSAFTEKATAVTQISDGVNFSRNDYYSYKNGTSQYMLFQLDGVVVAVEKGTSFNFEQMETKEDALNNSSIMGIWFSTDKDGLKYDKKGNRTESIVTAQVVITNDLYNDFIGKLVTLKNEDEEWSMFVGVPGDRYKKLEKESKEGIESLISTFELSLDNTGEFDKPEYAVVISGNNVGEIIEDVAIRDEEVPVVTKAEQNSVKSVDITAAVSEDVVTSEDVEEQTEEVEVIQAEADVQEASISPPVQTVSDNNEDAVSEPGKRVAVASTVRDTVEDDKAYSSNIFSMLIMGQAGICNIKRQSGNDNDTVIVKLTGVYDSGKTKGAIERAEAAGAPAVKYQSPPPGCHWESASFDINCQTLEDIPYLDVRMVGADGESLKFRGIRYAERTYDISADSMEGSWIKGYRVYYAVPNGCTEYVLKAGDGNDINGWSSAYYYVNRSV